MTSEIYFMVLAYRKNDEWWNAKRSLRSQIVRRVQRLMNVWRNKLLVLRVYKSVRWDYDVIFWMASYDPEVFGDFKIELNNAFRGLSAAGFSMLSLYEESPYLKPGLKLEDTLSQGPSRFFIAYPMSKNSEWYLLDFEERKKILAEHVGMARSHPEGKSVRSYTSYSYGLGDYEFVVIYETDSLAAWSHVTAKLREARARKWVNKETPIIVGVLSDVSFLARL